MTTPPPYDPAHPAVGTVQAWLNVGHQRLSEQEMLIMTVRVPNATVTVVLGKADAQTWIDALQAEVDQMSSLAIAPAGLPVQGLSQNTNGHPRG